MEIQQMNVTFDRLMLDPANARKKYDQDSIKSMKASILAEGIIQPLAVRPPQDSDADLGGQMYRVFAGGRRMRSVAQLIEEKALPADFAIPIIVRTNVTDARATSMSLAENIIRHDMEPVDEFRAFKDLADQGDTVEEIALRFGQTPRFVKGRLALGNLHPTILEALAADNLSFAAACAYTINPDQDAQIKYFETAEPWARSNSHNIKSALRGQALRANSALAEFIGEERYVEAGGEVRADLFGEDVFWPSADIIEQLKTARVAEEREKALLDGWQFFETTEEFGSDLWSIKSLAPEPVALSKKDAKRMDKIAEDVEGMAFDDPDREKLEAEYEALEAKMARFTPEQMAMSGVVVDLNALEWKYGAIKGKTPAKVPGNGSAGDEGSVGEGTAAAKPAKDPLALTQPLRDMIGNTATLALQAQVAANPHMALALLAAMLEQSGNHMMGIGRPSRIKVEQVGYNAEKAHKERGIDKAFAHYETMKPAELNKALAGLIAETVDLSEAWFQKDFTSDDRREKTRTGFLTAFGAEPLAHFDAAAFFASSSKPMIDAAMKEMTGYSATKPKKAQMAEEAAEAAGRTGWLPKLLRLKGFKLKKG